MIYQMRLSSLEVKRRKLSGLPVNEADNVVGIGWIYEDVAYAKVSMPDMC